MIVIPTLFYIIREHLNSPGVYKPLIQYYIKYRNCPLQNNTFLVTPRRSAQSLRNDDLSVMKVKTIYEVVQLFNSPYERAILGCRAGTGIWSRER